MGSLQAEEESNGASGGDRRADAGELPVPSPLDRTAIIKECSWEERSTRRNKHKKGEENRTVAINEGGQCPLFLV